MEVPDRSNLAPGSGWPLSLAVSLLGPTVEAADFTTLLPVTRAATQVEPLPAGSAASLAGSPGAVR